MEKHEFKKKYGQNFLQDENILKKIHDIITPGEKDLIIEIGPGSGNLTKWLQKYNCNLICYEIDTSLKERLEIIKNEKTQIIFEDFMLVNLKEVVSKLDYDNIYVIANIPYYITTPIIEKIIKSNINVKKMVLMVQNEVANRLTAKPKTKEYGYITVWLNTFYKTTKEFIVKKTCFYPIPKVDSAIISLTKKENSINDFSSFDNLIKSAFQFKRKTLNNNLKKYDKNIIEKVLNKYNYSLNNRAEEIPLEIYHEIYNSLKEK